MYEFMELFMYMARETGLFGTLESSTSKISMALGQSQQTVSRKLIEMEEKKLIVRKVTPQGVSLQLTKEGRGFLQETYGGLAKAFHHKEKAISGKLQSGLGEGAFYVNKKPYQEQFMKKLGYRAYPGTLNLHVGVQEHVKLADREPILIDGFSTKERTYGGLKCYRAKIQDQQVAISVPDRTIHGEEILEVIAPVFLREKLQLQDGNVVKVVPL